MESFISEAITVITVWLQVIAFLVILYYLCISFFGIYRKKEKQFDNVPDKTFALVVAAHNEEVVVEQIVESLKRLDYNRELYDIFVIADNCTDSTAELARNAGALVCERFDPDKRGKGYALEWMFDKIFRMDKRYDAVVVFDADNLASKNFLSAMNLKLKEGYKVVQGYLDSKNPHDSWITEAYSIAFWSNNRLFQLARNNLGLSNQIGGTGFCIDTDTLKELGWGATCLTEDLEFTCKLVLNGHRVGWAHDAVIYDEKPITLKQSWNQRKRWMQGFADVASRFFFKLLKKAFKERSWRAFDCALYTIQPYVTILAGICVVLTAVQLLGANMIFVLTNWFNSDNVIYFQLFAVFQFLFTPIIMAIDKKVSKRLVLYFALYSSSILLFGKINAYFMSKLNVDKDVFSIELMLIMGSISLLFLAICIGIAFVDNKTTGKVFIRYLLYSIYVLTWFPITIQAILDKDNKEWSHTKHTRGISINELENIDEKSVA
ncbi:MAG: glycosyltransferase family 2 protein [Clostridium sp.]